MLAVLGRVRMPELVVCTIASVVTGVTLGTASVVAVASPSTVKASDSLPDSAADETTAAKLAAQSGRRVEVERFRTETDQTFVNPDGSWTREQFVEPVRVRVGEVWKEVDDSLVAEPDGYIRPAVSPVDIRISGGGLAPLLSIGQGGVVSGMTWPSSLPAPTLDGATATYSNVFPDVDLAVTVAGTSVSERLVIKTRAAAQNPGVRSVKLGTFVKGGKLKASAEGGFSVVDAQGRVRMASPAPLMWDTAGTGDEPPTAAKTSTTKLSANRLAASATEPATSATTSQSDVGESLISPQEGDQTAPMDQSFNGSTMTVTPDATLLDDADTVYPVVVDPVLATAGISNWAMVDKTYPTTSYYNWSDQDQGVGYQNFSGVSTKRLFFGFNTSFLVGKDVQGATLSVYETSSATCAAGTVDVYLTNSVNSAKDTWNTQPTRSTGVLGSITTKAGRSDCKPGGYLAEVNVASGVQTRADQGITVTTLGLAGRSETSYSSWMRFAGPKNSTVSKRPKLTVTYNSDPNTPSTSKMSAPSPSAACATSASSPRVINPTSSNAYFQAFGGDPDGGTIYPYFYVWKNDGNPGTYMGNVNAGTKTGTTSAGVTYKGRMLPLHTGAALVNGTTYKWRTRVSDGGTWGDYSAYCYFTVDTSAPEAPTVTSETYQDGQLAPSDTTYGKFTFSAPGASGFWYSLNGVEKAYLAKNTTVNGVPAWTGNMSIPTSTVGYLEVSAQDAAGNKGVKSEAFYFKRAVQGKLAEYLFNDPKSGALTPTVAADTATVGEDGSSIVSSADAPSYAFNLMGSKDAWGSGRWAAAGCYDPDAGWLCGEPQNRDRTFAGTTEGPLDTEKRPFVSDRPFTVGAWVRLSDDDARRTAVALNLEEDPANGAVAPASFSISFDPTVSNGTLPDGTAAQPGRFVASLRGANGTVYRALDSLPKTVANGATGSNDEVSRTNSWVYVVAIYNGTTLKLDTAHELVTDTDGLPKAYVGPATTVGASAPGLGSFRVGDGAVAADGSAMSPWTGDIDNLSVWQQALSDTTTNNQVATNIKDQR